LKNRQIDILIGTQIIAKGLDIPNVDLVGVVSADVGLHLPYYKAAERTFQLITQVIGRSGRRDKPGKAILQTYWPKSLSIMAAGAQHYETFYRVEIENRKKFNLPPFIHLVRVVASDVHQEKARREIEKIAQECQKRGLEYLGPAKAFFAKIRGKFRFHLIIKINELPNKALTEVFLTNPYLFWDVNPENLL
jgi:primosomal protein N' (replication factor Y)